MSPIRHSLTMILKEGSENLKVTRTRKGRRPGAVQVAQNLSKHVRPRRLGVRALRDVTALGCLGHG
eukprot:9475580-Pyramimonas_sp.AAC.1